MSATAVQSFIQNLSAITSGYGVLGLGMGMFLESLGIPFASALVALTAGTLIATGKTSFIEALLISTAGLTLGSIVSYYIGYWGGELGRFVLGCPDERRNKFTELYRRWGEFGILIAQLFGVTRTWISLPAGAMKMRLRNFILYTTIGGAIYSALTIGLSMVLATMLARLAEHFQENLYLSLLAISVLVIIAATGYYYWKQRTCSATGESVGKPKKRSLR
ncbi:MAG: DedA family protein [Bacillota bacterium]|nr:DedA family protein [Bacillota bacterium]MDW7683897.1 DedA family protein [Bacillota bacterium]